MLDACLKNYSRGYKNMYGMPTLLQYKLALNIQHIYLLRSYSVNK